MKCYKHNDGRVYGTIISRFHHLESRANSVIIHLKVHMVAFFQDFFEKLMLSRLHNNLHF